MNIFAPMLYLKKVAPAIEFYKKAFDAIEMKGAGAMMMAVCMWQKCQSTEPYFICMKKLPGNNELSPETLKGTPVAIGLFVSDVNALMAKAIAAGGTELESR